MATSNIKPQSGIWISWETQTRNRSLSYQMGAVLFEKDIKLSPLLRYPYLIIWTTLLLLKTKARIIFVQNPSLILSFLAVVLGKFILKKHVIVDAHNIALEPIVGIWRFLEVIRVFVIMNATYTIVSNDGLITEITIHKGKPLVLADPLPILEAPVVEYKLTGKYTVLYICSWANDEPYCDVIKAASLLDNSITLYISGNHKDKHKFCVSEIPKNVILTGFLDNREFEYLLHTVNVIMDLTTRSDCLLCGAYEGVAAEKPLVLSDTEALKRYFYKGTIYTNNTAVDIAKKINIALNDKKYYTEILDLKKEIDIAWLKQKEIINETISSLES